MALFTNALTDFRGETLRGSPGFFRVGRTHAGQWWLIDGSDRPFFAKAVHGVSAQANEVHDPAARLRSWGFNALGAASGRLYLEEGLPFLATVDFGAKATPVHLAGVRLPDVFNSDWPKDAQRRAAEVCAPLAESSEVIGWLTDDCPGWPSAAAEERPGLLQVCLSLEPGLAAYHAAWEFVCALYGHAINGLTRAWGLTLTNKESLRAMTRQDRGIATRGYRRDDERWTREFAQRYFSTATSAIREQAPHHLVLGCRWGGPVSAALRQACASVADVCFVDHTEIPDNGSAPVMVGDFSWVSARFFDGLSSRRMLGPTKVERMLRRGRLALTRAVGHPAVVGYAWSRWHDRSGELPPFGTGLVRKDETEAREHTELLTAVNDRVEEIRGMTLIPDLA